MRMQKENHLPIEVQAGASYKLKHAPFRISILGQHLNQWRVLYEDPNEQPTIDGLTGDTIPVNQTRVWTNIGKPFCVWT